MADDVRIAMWSGPRNISTAMMYSFDNRRDCFATDEPLYAHYLKQTGIKHPDAQMMMAPHASDSATVVDSLTGEIPRGAAVWSQKHMCHHILPGMDTDWLDSLSNCFLIRNPKEVLLSLSKITDEVSLWSTGLPQQVRLMQDVSKNSGSTPPIIDCREILENPKGMLRLLCEQWGIDFSERMLSWDAGPRECDGIWGEPWYDPVWSSTGCDPYRHRLGALPPQPAAIPAMAMPW